MIEKTLVILKDLHGVTGRAEVTPRGDPALVIMCPSASDSEAGYIPPESVYLYGREALVQLKQLCEEALKACDDRSKS